MITVLTDKYHSTCKIATVVLPHKMIENGKSKQT